MKRVIRFIMILALVIIFITGCNKNMQVPIENKSIMDHVSDYTSIQYDTTTPSDVSTSNPQSTNIEYSTDPVSINHDLLADIGKPYREIKEKYGAVTQSDYYDGGIFFIFENSPGMYFFVDDNGYSNIETPDDNAKCFVIKASANCLFIGLEGMKLISEIEQEIGVSIECDEDLLNGGYYCRFHYENYYVYITQCENNESIPETGFVDIRNYSMWG